MYAVAVESSRTKALPALALTLALAATAATPSAAGPALRPVQVESAIRGAAEGLVGIIVQKWNAADSSAERGIERIGGKVDRRLPIIGGFSATVPATSADSLSELRGARYVSLDRRVYVQGAAEGSSVKSAYPKAVEADKMWNAGYTGKGVTVALVDTGIADVADLAGRVLPVYDDIKMTWSPCVNLSGEGDCADSYGHGTFIAGIIGGNGAASGGA